MGQKLLLISRDCDVKKHIASYCLLFRGKFGNANPIPELYVIQRNSVYSGQNKWLWVFYPLLWNNILKEGRKRSTTCWYRTSIHLEWTDFVILMEPLFVLLFVSVYGTAAYRCSRCYKSLVEIFKTHLWFYIFKHWITKDACVRGNWKVVLTLQAVWNEQVESKDVNLRSGICDKNLLWT